jgi:hypothetical protein
MGIDGIGKPPAPPSGGVGGPAGTLGPSSTGKSFDVAPSDAASATSATAPTGSPELERLGRGEISLDQYLQTRVDEATQHLSGKLSPEQLDYVKSTLRAQLESDPVLIELVRRATGKTLGA